MCVHSIKVFVLNVLSVFVFEKGDTVDTDDAVRCTQCGFLSGYRAAMNLTAFQPSNHCNCCNNIVATKLTIFTRTPYSVCACVLDPHPQDIYIEVKMACVCVFNHGISNCFIASTPPRRHSGLQHGKYNLGKYKHSKYHSKHCVT